MAKPTVLSILSFITLLIGCIVFSSCGELQELLMQAAEDTETEDTSAEDTAAEDTSADDTGADTQQ